MKDNMEVVKQISDWLGSGSINFFGRPHAGKDTQGRYLADLLGAPLLGGGDILRGSEIPEHVKQIMHAGQLIPTNDYLKIVLPFLQREELRGKPLVLSAVGRWHGEEAGFLEAMAVSSHPLKAVVYLNIPEEEVWRRWESHKEIHDRGERRDDDYEALKVRLKEFEEKTMPVIDFYRDQNLVIEVDSKRPKDEVSAEILKKLSILANRDAA